MDMLKVEETTPENKSIQSFEYFPFNPITGTQYNNPGIIQINIENQAEYFYPRRSWLQIEGRLLKATDAVYDNNDLITLINNGILYCFSNIKYLLSGSEIESLNHPGHASTMLGLLKYSKEYSGVLQCWIPDTTDKAEANNTGFVKRRNFIFSSDPVGTFVFALDLEHILGFAEDYDKVIMGFQHSLQFSRSSDDSNAIFRDEHVAVGKVELKNITWWMPIIRPAELESNRLTNIIYDKASLEVWFRMRQCAMISLPLVSSYTWNLGVRTGSERPRYIIVGLQTSKKDDQKTNPAIFDHVNVQNMKVRLNSTEYPAVQTNSNFTKNDFAYFFMRMVHFNQYFYGVDRMLTSTVIDGQTYKDLFPIFVFDVSKQNENLVGGVVDISVIMNFSANVAANTQAFALVISDRKLKFQSNGKKMNVVF